MRALTSNSTKLNSRASVITTMERFTIEITDDGALYTFDILDLVHDEGEKCKFEVYRKDEFIASFEPDSRGFLHICKNPGKVDEPVLHLIADKLEAISM